MRTAVLTLALVFLVAAVGPVHAEQPGQPNKQPKQPKQPEPVDTGPLVEGNTAFALALYRQLAGKPGNLFFSPTSISTALAMTREGAAGATRAQMDAVLHLPSEESAKACRALLRALEPPLVQAGYGREARQVPAYELTVANRLWGQRGFGFLPDFLGRLKSSFAAGLQEVDFLRAGTAARETINRWVAGKTKGRIRDLLPAGQPTPDTRLVLTNAIYFKAAWLDRFAQAGTVDAPFHKEDGTPVRARFMRQQEHFGYGEAEDVQVLSMPYRHGKLSMIVVLPRTPDGLAAVEAKLDPETLAGWLESMTHREVFVRFPKFEFTSTFRLNEALQSLGMTQAFSHQADFSRMARVSKAERLFLGLVVHKAFVAVDEEGTEAAAATAVIITPTAAPVRTEPPAFTADRPFLFLIRHRKTGSLLFVGRVADPLQS